MSPPRVVPAALGLALLGVGALGLWDAALALLRAFPSFETGGERLRFLLFTALCPLGPAVILGLLGGAATRALLRLGRALELGVALLAAPLVAWVCSQVFQGPRAQTIPGRHLLALLLGVLALAALTLGLRGARALWRRLDHAAAGRRALWVAGLLALAAAAAHHADLRVLPRLYLWFHLSLLTLALGAAVLAAAFAALAAPALRRGWLRSPGLQVLVVGLALAGSGLGLFGLRRSSGIRGAALDHAALAGRVLALLGLLRGGDAPQTEAEDRAEAVVTPPGPGPHLPGADVYLITVDALRADRLRPDLMPTASALADSGVRFERAYTQVPHTSFAVATLLTGKPVYALMTMGQGAADHETLPLVLRRARYKTAAFYPPSVFYIEHERLKALEQSAYGFEYVKFEYLDGDRRTDQVQQFFASEHPERVFLWIHYLEPHEPYEVHPGGPPASASDERRYDGEARFVDQQIARLLTILRQRRREGLVIIAADHGEEFGEHGGRYHGTTLYEEQVRVPLIIAPLHPPAAQLPAGRRVAEPVGLIDVGPTILGLLDIAPSARMRGHDVGPWLSAARPLPDWPVYGEIGRQKMVVQGHHKLLCDLAKDHCALYDLQQDPREQRNLMDREAAEGQRLRGLLNRYLLEASRFERTLPIPGGASQDAALTEEERAALLQGRLGERSAGAVLGRLAQGPEGPVRREATALLAQLCVALEGAPDREARSAAVIDREARSAAVIDPAWRAALAAAAQSADLETRRWAAVGRLRLDPADAAALEAVRELLRQGAPDGAGDEGKRRGAAALALAASLRPEDVPLLLSALPEVLAQDDPDRARPVLLALGRSRDGRALPLLLAQLENVRSRADVVAALGELGQEGAVAALVERLAEDPYVPVRAAAATALGRLGGPRARAALQRALKREREQPVRAAVQAALTP